MMLNLSRYVVRQVLFFWQDMNTDEQFYSAFDYFCDTLEIKDGVVASASGWGADWALPQWATFWQTQMLRLRT